MDRGRVVVQRAAGALQEELDTQAGAAGELVPCLLARRSHVVCAPWLLCLHVCTTCMRACVWVSSGCAGVGFQLLAAAACSSRGWAAAACSHARRLCMVSAAGQGLWHGAHGLWEEQGGCAHSSSGCWWWLGVTAHLPECCECPLGGAPGVRH